MNLKEYLSQFNDLTCPDYYYQAYKILFMEGRKDYSILSQAEKDMEEELRLRPQTLFNNNRRKMGGLGKRKYNWY